MPVRHFKFQLSPKRRGFHLITSEIISSIGSLPAMDGLLHVHILHTSAGLTINENADPDVLVDYEMIFNRLVPENLPGLQHTIEGPDDMPAHIKSTLTGHHVSIPFTKDGLLLGTWQGVYLCEFRNHAQGRRLVVSVVS